MSDGKAPLAGTDDAGRHRLTVLFADIQGSTELIQHMDAEDAASIIDPAIAAMVEEVERHKAVVGHRGDGIMATFGGPSVCEDHALRACLAAIAIRERVAKLGTPGVQVRIGIHTGEVVVSRVRIGGTHIQQATGVAVHVAARLEQTALPGAICISDAALALVRGYVQTRGLRAINVKGVDEAVARFELVGVDTTANRWRVRAANGLNAIVNRLAEMATLNTMLVAPDQPGLRIAQLAGPAGIGKSRMLHEFTSGVAAQACTIVRLTGDQHHQDVAFHSINAWLRDAMNIGAVADADEARARVTATCAAIPGDPMHATVIVQRILGLHTAAAESATTVSSPATEVARIISDLIAWQSAGRRLIIACEDVDQFDAASRDLLLALIDRLAHCDALIVATSRSKARLRTGRPTQMLHVAPLTRDQTVTLLHGIDRRLAERTHLAATIADKAGGNPLFVEEVASLVLKAVNAGQKSADASKQDELTDAWALIPDRVQALIADRLGSLPVELRRIVRVCAVIGLDVPVALLSALTGLTDDVTYRSLLKLASEQLIYETRRYPNPQFSFRHALIRDVAYHTLLAARRRELHAQIVAILDADGTSLGDDRLDGLCYHALQARLWEAAFGYLRTAAAAAVDKFAYQVAHTHLTRALEVSRHLPETPDLTRAQLSVSMDLRLLLLALDRYPDAANLLEDAEKAAERLSDTVSRVRIMGWRVHVLTVLGDLREAVNLGARAFDMVRGSNEPRLIVSAAHYLGQARFNIGDLRGSDEVLAHAARVAPQMSAADRATVGGSMPVLVSGTRAMALSLRGRFSEAAEEAAAALGFARDTGRPYDVAFAHSADGIRLLQAVDPSAAAVTIEAGLALAREARLVQLHPPLRIGLGHAHLLRNDLPAAYTVLSEGLEEARARKRHMMLIWAAAGLAMTELRLGHPARAEESATEAVIVADRFGYRAFKVMAARTLGLVLLQRPDRRQAAHATLDAALALANELDMQAEIAHCHAALARAGGASAARHREVAEIGYGRLGIATAAAVTGGFAEHAAIVRLVPAQS